MKDPNPLLPDLLLHFNIQHPDLEDCYTHGYEASLAGEIEKANPYKNDSKAYQFWQEGWWDGYYLAEPAFGCKETMLQEVAANDEVCAVGWDHVLHKIIEITSVLAVPILVGYQVLDLVV